jgi:hypothetical protein
LIYIVFYRNTNNISRETASKNEGSNICEKEKIFYDDDGHCTYFYKFISGLWK